MLFRKKFWGDKPKDKAIYDPETGQIISDLAEDGSEILDPTPIAPPIGFTRTKSMMEQVRDMVRSERLAEEARREGYETFEESEDFDVDDDFDPSTPYENDFDPPISEVKEAVEAEKKGRGEKSPPVAPKEPTPGEAPPEPLKNGSTPVEGGDQ